MFFVPPNPSAHPPVHPCATHAPSTNATISVQARPGPYLVPLMQSRCTRRPSSSNSAWACDGDPCANRQATEPVRKRRASGGGNTPPRAFGHTSGHTNARRGRSARRVRQILEENLEAPPGFEPGMEVLQTSALPLGYGAPREGVGLSPYGNRPGIGARPLTASAVESPPSRFALWRPTFAWLASRSSRKPHA